ncbi:MAG: hypothetical protein AABM67_07425 [Acidobacteriota bacterium]
MNSHSTNQCHPSKLSSLLIAITLIGFVQGLSYARPQDTDLAQLTLVTRQDGFSGVYADNGKAYTIENRELKDEFRTRIIRPDGRSLVESHKEAGIVYVVLPTGKVRIDISNPSSFSADETRAIEEFAKSTDCALVKKIVVEVFKKRASEKPSLLGGFRVISMFLGE